LKDILDLLRLGKENDASDLHLIDGCPPLLRVDGELQAVDGEHLLTQEEIKHGFTQVTTRKQREDFERTLELDFGYNLPGVGRIRCNAAWQRGAISFAMRILPFEIPTIDGLELPQKYKDIALSPRGLVIISGPTGSGKSTTLAAMINHVNHSRACHIVTIEDPIEYTHPNIKSAVTQREIGYDTLSFVSALKYVLRQDPDIILVGEMRDYETANSVLTVAETGHLVFTTGHAPSSTQAIERVIDMFPPEQRYFAQVRLASLMLGVFYQTLVPRASGSGRIAAIEVMLGTPAVRNLVREGKIYQLPNIIRTSSKDGMQTLDYALVNYYRHGVITGETLARYCKDPDEVEKLVGKVAA